MEQIVVRSAAELNGIAPQAPGQLAVNIDSRVIYIATGTSRGAWSSDVRADSATDTSLLKIAQVTLTNAQILALPSTAISIVPDQGPGRVIQFLIGTCLADFRGGAYADFSSFLAWFTIGSIAQSVRYNEDIEGAFADDSGIHVITFIPRVDNVSSEVLATWISEVNDIENRPLSLKASNVGALSGGHASNSMKVTVYYSLLTI